jgi:hypothetical protein
MYKYRTNIVLISYKYRTNIVCTYRVDLDTELRRTIMCNDHVQPDNSPDEQLESSDNILFSLVNGMLPRYLSDTLNSHPTVDTRQKRRQQKHQKVG